MSRSGRASRRQKREKGRQAAKELLAAKSGERPEHKYRTELVVAAISLFLPLGWGELMSGDHQAWRVALGWGLWLIPFSLVLHVFWRWSQDWKRFAFVRVGLIGIALLIFLGASGYSTWDSMLPNFVFVKPGVVINPNDPTAHWTFTVVVRGREPFYNVNVNLSDAVKRDETARRLRGGEQLGRDEVFSDIYTHQYQEIDPYPSTKMRDTEVDMFGWRAPHLEDEKYVIDIKSRTSGVVENLEIKKIDGSWQVAMKVVDDKSQNTLIRCKDPKFPAGPDWPEALPGCFPEYSDRYRDLSRYKLLVLKVFGLQRFE